MKENFILPAIFPRINQVLLSDIDERFKNNF